MGAKVSAFFGGNDSINDDFVDLEKGLTLRVESPIVQQKKKMRRQVSLSKDEEIFAKVLKDRFGINYNDIREDERNELRERVNRSTRRSKYLKRGENTGKIPSPEDYFYAGLNFGGKTKRKKRRMKYTKKKK